MKDDHLSKVINWMNKQTDIIAQRINTRAGDSVLGGGISGLLITEKSR